MAADRHALALGIAPGMKLADALARVPELIAFDHDPRADARALDQLAQLMERYTPMVATAPPDALILDITGAEHFYRSETALARDAEDRCDTAGFAPLWALGSSADAALALARHGLNEGAEAQLPVTALGLEAEASRALIRAGLPTIGDLVSRPQAVLAARFGATMVTALDRLLGRADSPISPLARIGQIITERRFTEPLTHGPMAQAVITELFAEACLTMAERDLGAREIAIRLFRCDGAQAQMALETGSAMRDPAAFERLLRERMDALDDPLNPGFGFDMIRLTIIRSEPLTARQLLLDGAAAQASDMAALIGNLSARLGRGNIRCPVPADSHLPEQGLLALPALDTASSTPAVQWEEPPSDEPPPRPLHLFDPPERVQVLAEVPDGPPYRFIWRRKAHQVARVEGPERIADEWWRRADGQQPGKGGLTRDYYRVEDVRGRRYWLFRHGLYGREAAHPVWYLHGLFA